MYWRTPSFSLTCVALLIVQALLFGIILLGADFTTYQGVVSGMGMLYMVVVFDGFVTLNGVIPLASNERASYYRERSSETYSAVWYFVGSTAAEIPLTMVASLLFTAIFYPLVGFSGWDTAALFWLNLWLFGLQQAYVGQLFAYVMPSQEVAVAAGLLFDNILYIFTGYTPPYAMLPDGYKWLYHINPIQFALSVAGALVFADCSTEPEFDQALGAFSNVGPELGCQPMRDAPVSVGNITVKEYAEQTFRMRYDDIAFDFGFTVAFIVVFRVLALPGLRYVRHQKR